MSPRTIERPHHHYSVVVRPVRNEFCPALNCRRLPLSVVSDSGTSTRMWRACEVVLQSMVQVSYGGSSTKLIVQVLHASSIFGVTMLRPLYTSGPSTNLPS